MGKNFIVLTNEQLLTLLLNINPLEITKRNGN